MTSAREHSTIVRARRRIRNLGACVRRDVTGGSAAARSPGTTRTRSRRSSAVENALGVDRTGPLSDRLRNVRWEAQAAGLLEPAEILDAETHALAAAGCVA